MKITKLPNVGKNVGNYDDVNIIKLPNGGELHEYPNGDKWWFLNGKLHRENGPAVEWINAYKEWCINGELLPCKTQKEFEQLMRLRAFW